VAAGGTRVTMDDPSLVTMSLRHPDPGFEIVTPWERRADALAVLSELASGPATAAGCVRVASVGREQYPVPAVVLAPRRARGPRRGGPSGATARSTTMGRRPEFRTPSLSPWTWTRRAASASRSSRVGRRT